MPESSCFYFSPTEQTRELFYYPTICGHFYCTKDYYIKRNTFPPLLLLYVRKGTLCLDLGEEHYEASEGQILFFDCKQPHHYYAKTELEFLFLHFDGPQAHQLCKYINQPSGALIDGESNERIHQALADMIQFHTENGNESVFSSSNRIYQLLVLLDNPGLPARLKKHDDSIDRAILYIRSNIGKKITLRELAEMCGLSDYYFSHLFKEIIGFSPSNFIINSRIDRAKTLLVTTNLPISEISRQVGYPNSSNLIVHFTQRVGCSPLQFRLRHHGK